MSQLTVDPRVAAVLSKPRPTADDVALLRRDPSLLRSLIAAVQSTESFPAATEIPKASFILGALKNGGDNGKAVMAALRGSGESRVCAKPMTGEPAFHCFDCAADPTCIFCATCFRNAPCQALGHRFRMLTSTAGMCDCGDPSAWNEECFCTAHGGVGEDVLDHVDPALLAWLAPTLAASLELVIRGAAALIRGGGGGKSARTSSGGEGLGGTGNGAGGFQLSSSDDDDDSDDDGVPASVAAAKSGESLTVLERVLINVAEQLTDFASSSDAARRVVSDAFGAHVVGPLPVKKGSASAAAAATAEPSSDKPAPAKAMNKKKGKSSTTSVLPSATDVAKGAKAPSNSAEKSGGETGAPPSSATSTAATLLETIFVLEPERPKKTFVSLWKSIVNLGSAVASDTSFRGHFMAGFAATTWVRAHTPVSENRGFANLGVQILTVTPTVAAAVARGQHPLTSDAPSAHSTNNSNRRQTTPADDDDEDDQRGPASTTANAAGAEGAAGANSADASLGAVGGETVLSAMLSAALLLPATAEKAPAKLKLGFLAHQASIPFATTISRACNFRYLLYASPAASKYFLTTRPVLRAWCCEFAARQLAVAISRSSSSGDAPTSMWDVESMDVTAQWLVYDTLKEALKKFVAAFNLDAFVANATSTAHGTASAECGANVLSAVEAAVLEAGELWKIFDLPTSPALAALPASGMHHIDEDLSKTTKTRLHAALALTNAKGSYTHATSASSSVTQSHICSTPVSASSTWFASLCAASPQLAVVAASLRPLLQDIGEYLVGVLGTQGKSRQLNGTLSLTEVRSTTSGFTRGTHVDPANEKEMTSAHVSACASPAPAGDAAPVVLTVPLRDYDLIDKGHSVLFHQALGRFAGLLIRAAVDATAVPALGGGDSGGVMPTSSAAAATLRSLILDGLMAPEIEIVTRPDKSSLCFATTKASASSARVMTELFPFLVESLAAPRLLYAQAQDDLWRRDFMNYTRHLSIYMQFQKAHFLELDHFLLQTLSVAVGADAMAMALLNIYSYVAQSDRNDHTAVPLGYGPFLQALMTLACDTTKTTVQPGHELKQRVLHLLATGDKPRSVLFEQVKVLDDDGKRDHKINLALEEVLGQVATTTRRRDGKVFSLTKAGWAQVNPYVAEWSTSQIHQARREYDDAAQRATPPGQQKRVDTAYPEPRAPVDHAPAFADGLVSLLHSTAGLSVALSLILCRVQQPSEATASSQAAREKLPKANYWWACDSNSLTSAIDFLFLAVTSLKSIPGVFDEASGIVDWDKYEAWRSSTASTPFSVADGEVVPPNGISFDSEKERAIAYAASDFLPIDITASSLTQQCPETATGSAAGSPPPPCADGTSTCESTTTAQNGNDGGKQVLSAVALQRALLAPIHAMELNVLGRGRRNILKATQAMKESFTRTGTGNGNGDGDRDEDDVAPADESTGGNSGPATLSGLEAVRILLGKKDTMLHNIAPSAIDRLRTVERFIAAAVDGSSISGVGAGAAGANAGADVDESEVAAARAKRDALKAKQAATMARLRQKQQKAARRAGITDDDAGATSSTTGGPNTTSGTGADGDANGASGSNGEAAQTTPWLHGCLASFTEEATCAFCRRGGEAERLMHLCHPATSDVLSTFATVTGEAAVRDNFSAQLSKTIEGKTHDSGEQEETMPQNTLTGHLNFCGHLAHGSCFAKWSGALDARREDQLSWTRRQLLLRGMQRGTYFTRGGEILCPVCTRIVSCALPGVPATDLEADDVRRWPAPANIADRRTETEQDFLDAATVAFVKSSSGAPFADGTAARRIEPVSLAAARSAVQKLSAIIGTSAASGEVSNVNDANDAATSFIETADAQRLITAAMARAASIAELPPAPIAACSRNNEPQSDSPSQNETGSQNTAGRQIADALELTGGTACDESAVLTVWRSLRVFAQTFAVHGVQLGLGVNLTVRKYAGAASVWAAALSTVSQLLTVTSTAAAEQFPDETAARAVATACVKVALLQCLFADIATTVASTKKNLAADEDNDAPAEPVPEDATSGPTSSEEVKEGATKRKAGANTVVQLIAMQSLVRYICRWIDANDASADSTEDTVASQTSTDDHAVKFNDAITAPVMALQGAVLDLDILRLVLGAAPAAALRAGRQIHASKGATNESSSSSVENVPALSWALARTKALIRAVVEGDALPSQATLINNLMKDNSSDIGTIAGRIDFQDIVAKDAKPDAQISPATDRAAFEALAAYADRTQGKATVTPPPADANAVGGMAKTSSVPQALLVVAPTASALTDAFSTEMFRIPRSYGELLLRHESATMRTAGAPYLQCLRCGVARNMSPVDVAEHAIVCGGGSSMLLDVSRTQLFSVQSANGRLQTLGPVHVDEFGEADVGLRRGHPLALDEDRRKELIDVWAGGLWDHHTAVLDRHTVLLEKVNFR